MSLVSRFTLLFVFVSLMVFLVGGVITHQIMTREINAEQQRFLNERLSQAERFIEIRQPGRLVDRGKLVITPLDSAIVEQLTVFSDTLVMHSTLQRLEPHLKLSAVRNINGRNYGIVIYDVIIEADDIIDVVIESLTKTYLILLVAFTLLGLLVFNYQLRPFRHSLHLIKTFSVSGDPLKFQSTRISEFKQLNRFLDEMTNRARRDYQNLKEFSENASHELQTPIAIIKAKLDVLIQSDNLDEDQLALIESAHMTIKRLTDLSNSLSLLTKIENREFANQRQVDFTASFCKIMEGFKELLELKKIHYDIDLVGKPVVVSDPVLIEVLITNLINNALKHNHEKGTIKVKIEHNQFTISNSGQLLKTPPEELFNRFKKSNQSDPSLGLGLAIVKKICDFYGFKVEYKHHDKQHTVSVVFM